MAHSDRRLQTGGSGVGVALGAVSISLSFMAAGCQSQYREFSRQLTSNLAQGRYTEAAEQCGAKVAALEEDDADMVIYLLEAGRTAQLAGEVETSRRWYEDVQTRLRPYLDTEAEATVREAIATIAVNQTVAIYRGTPSDRMLACALNAINLLSLRRFDDARVELNRAADWQRDAVDRYRAQIESELAKTRKAETREEGEDSETQATVSQASLDEQLARPQFRNLENLTAYADYANPFIDHLRGVFYLALADDPGDLESARFAFRQTVAMEPECRTMVDPDLATIDAASSGRPTPTTWIYFMTGLGPRLEQFRVDVPIPVGDVNYVSAAFPALRFDNDFEKALAVEAAGVDPINAVPLADMDRIVAAEFRARLPLIITQEIASAAVKATATYGLQAGLGSYGQIAGIIYQAASTAVDLRLWRSVPKRILVGRVSTPTDGRLALSASRPLCEVKVQPGVSNIVLVALPASRTPVPSVLAIPLDRSMQAAAFKPN
jgi:hypothetical protein